MNTTLMLNWTERAGFLLLAWHGLALTVSLLAWVTVSGLRRRSCVARSWIARAALVVAVLAPLLGLAVNSLPKKTAAAQSLTVSGSGSAFAAVDWDKIAVWKPLMARVDFAAVELPEKNGRLTVSGRQLGLSLFALLVTALLVRGAICFALAWRGKNRLLSEARRAEAGRFAACREVATLTLTKLPELRFSASVSGPMLAGVFKPVLLLPDESFTREPVLLHEFTHLRRRDTLWQTLALTLRLCAPLQFGFALLQCAMRQADEEVCDDAVIARGADRGAYATLLLDMAERRHLRGEFVLSMAAVSQLERRVRRMLDAARSPIGKVSATWLALVVLAALTLTALGGWVYADIGKVGLEKTPSVQNKTVSVDERWMSVMIPEILCENTDITEVLTKLEKMAADSDAGKTPLRIKFQEPPPGTQPNRTLTLNLVRVNLIRILQFISSLTDFQLSIEDSTATFSARTASEEKLSMIEMRTDADPDIRYFFPSVGDIEQVDITAELKAKGIQLGKNCYAIYFPKLQKIVMNNTWEQYKALQELFVKHYKDAVAAEQQRLEHIVIPECHFTDATIARVLHDLQAECQRLDAGGKGVKFVYTKQRYAETSQQPPDSPRVNLQLKNAPLTVILDALQKQGAYEYMIGPSVVFVYSTADDNERVRSQRFDVEPEYFTTTMDAGNSTDVTKEFAAKGVEFKEGCHAIYFPKEKKLFVYNTGEQMDKVVEFLRLAREKQ